MPLHHADQVETLLEAIARYVAERPPQGSPMFHWPSFAHCFAHAVAAATQESLAEALNTAVLAGWLVEDQTGYSITIQGMIEARSGMRLRLRYTK